MKRDVHAGATSLDTIRPKTNTQLLAEILDVLQADRGVDTPADETDYRDLPIGAGAGDLYIDADAQYQYVYIPNCPRDVTLYTGTRGQYLGSWAAGASINFRMPRQIGLTVVYAAGAAAQTFSLFLSTRPIEINSVGANSPGSGVALAAADNMANPTAPWELSALMGWDGATWDRVATGKQINDDGTGLLAVVGHVARGGGFLDYPLAVHALNTDAVMGVGVAAVGSVAFNGTTWDRQRGNIEGTALASAARTATTQSADIVNYNGRGIVLWLRIELASGTGGLFPQVQAKDPISGQYVNLNVAPTAITAIGTYGYEIAPGASTAGTAGPGLINQRTAGELPRTFRVSVGAGDASSYTYSVSYCIIN